MPHVTGRPLSHKKDRRRWCILNRMADLTQEGALLADTFGTQFLAYLCAADEEVITRRLEGEVALGQAQEEVLAQLVALATQLAATAAENNVPVAMQLEVLGRVDQGA